MSEHAAKGQASNFLAKLSSVWLLERRKIIAASILGLTILILGGVAAFKLFKQEQVPAVIEVPEHSGSELPGWWYNEYFGSSVCDHQRCKPLSDPDGDKLTNEQEFYYRSDPLHIDTNNNGLTDGEDVAQNFDPSKPGKVTFEQAASDDTVFGESLLFGDDIKKIINEEVDPNKAQLPVVNDLELKISSDNSKGAVTAYLQKNNDIVTKYFSNDLESYMSKLFEQYDQDLVEEAKLNSAKAVIDLKKLEVPSNALQLHKYYIGLLILLPDVLVVPDEAALKDETNQAANYWYDQTQAFAILFSKIQLENAELTKLYP